MKLIRNALAFLPVLLLLSNTSPLMDDRGSRSPYGCPAVPLAFHQKIIDKIKNGACMFLYYTAKHISADQRYLTVKALFTSTV